MMIFASEFAFSGKTEFLQFPIVFIINEFLCDRHKPIAFFWNKNNVFFWNKNNGSYGTWFLRKRSPVAVAGALRVFFKIKNDPFFETLTFWVVFDQILTYLCIFVKYGHPIPSFWLRCPQPAQKKWPRGIHPLIPGSRHFRQSRQSGARAAAPNPTSLAPGARTTVVKHTPSNDDLICASSKPVQ